MFFYLAIFEWLVAAILLISIFLYVKRISMNNRMYGRAVLMEALTFSVANIVAGFFNYYLSKNLLETLLEDRDYNHNAIYSSIMIPYFIITEFLPSAVFGYTMQTFAKVLDGANEEDERREERAQNADALDRERENLA